MMDKTDIRAIATSITIKNSDNTEMKKQLAELEVMIQLAETEAFKQNIDTISGMMDQFSNLDARVRQLEIYQGSLKNRMEEHIAEYTKRTKKISDKEWNTLYDE
jgi:hypothetical protein